MVARLLQLAVGATAQALAGASVLPRHAHGAAIAVAGAEPPVLAQAVKWALGAAEEMAGRELAALQLQDAGLLLSGPACPAGLQRRPLHDRQLRPTLEGCLHHNRQYSSWPRHYYWPTRQHDEIIPGIHLS